MPPTKKCARKFGIWYDRRIQVEETTQALAFLMAAFKQFYLLVLGICKLTARLVPKFLSDEQMATRASVCSALLKRFRSKDDFLLLVTVDLVSLL